MGRFSRSWALVKESYFVLKANPQLAFFPFMSGIVSLVVTLTFLLPIWLTTNTRHGYETNPLHYVVLFCFYAVSYFVVIFFNAGLVSCAHESLAGRPTTWQSGMNNALRHIGPIIVWSLVAATVGTILRTISERAGLIGRIVIGILGMAWTMLTFFVLPLIVLGDRKAAPAIKESGSMLRATWGEQLIGGASIGLGFSLLTLLVLLPIAGAVFAIVVGLWPIAIALGLVTVGYVLLLAILSSTLSGIYNTALYIYASTGQVPNGFSEEYIRAAFMQKQSRQFFRS